MCSAGKSAYICVGCMTLPYFAHMYPKCINYTFVNTLVIRNQRWPMDMFMECIHPLADLRSRSTISRAQISQKSLHHHQLSDCFVPNTTRTTTKSARTQLQRILCQCIWVASRVDFCRLDMNKKKSYSIRVFCGDAQVEVVELLVYLCDSYSCIWWEIIAANKRNMA